MACATLKRSLDWESINQRPTKRRRCNPFGQSTSSMIGGQGGGRSSAHSSPSSSSAAAAAGLTVGGGMSSGLSGGMQQRCPCGRLNTVSASTRNLSIDNADSLLPESPFAGKMSTDKMAQNIRDEIKRLSRRKQLTYASAERMQDSESSGSEMGPESPRRRSDSPTHGNLAAHPEKALFTFKQVQMICERMLKEREDELREKYDAILTTKLAEQYDAFVKFTYDQIQRRYEAAPSYLS
ncbi:akirin [Episyrphus balteatus]|uniref:akirin n=1 Tax=Episyrphus balteatus TaxID=286459 RepID=UPI0024855256|nr:akirin [Episyrphus balteatus]